MKRITIILFAVLCGTMQVKAYQEQPIINIEGKKTINNVSSNPREITILNGAVVFKIHEPSDDFLCIGIEDMKRGNRTCVEIKKRGNFYLTQVDGKQYRSLDEAINDYWKGYFKRHYQDKKYGKKVWSAFIKEGGLQLFIDIAKEICNDEFLNSPFNEIYG